MIVNVLHQSTAGMKDQVKKFVIYALGWDFSLNHSSIYTVGSGTCSTGDGRALKGVCRGT